MPMVRVLVTSYSVLLVVLNLLLGGIVIILSHHHGTHLSLVFLVLFLRPSIHPSIRLASSLLAILYDRSDLNKDVATSANFNFFGDTYGRNHYDFVMNTSPAPATPSPSSDNNNGCDDGIGESSGWIIRRHQKCNANNRTAQLLYSSIGTATKWSSSNVALADTLVIYAR
jgi:hypothetical protein